MTKKKTKVLVFAVDRPEKSIIIIIIIIIIQGPVSTCINVALTTTGTSDVIPSGERLQNNLFAHTRLH